MKVSYFTNKLNKNPTFSYNILHCFVFYKKKKYQNNKKKHEKLFSFLFSLLLLVFKSFRYGFRRNKHNIKIIIMYIFALCIYVSFKKNKINSSAEDNDEQQKIKVFYNNVKTEYKK